MTLQILKEKDSIQLQKKGISTAEFSKQLEKFKQGFPKINLLKPATVSDGIVVLSESDIISFEKLYDSNTTYSSCKFVPASGAATRMFKALFSFSNSFDNKEEIIKVIESINTFSFGKEVIQFCQENKIDYKKTKDNAELKQIVDFIISDQGLNYGSLPKGMILFHEYEDFNRTAFEEHLTEGALYSFDKNREVNLHFTVAPQHQSKINQLIQASVHNFEKKYNVTYNISYSIQEPSTDTVAVDMSNNPFRLKSGELLFRPGGHGALLENLNSLSDDIIFIKNIDNVVHDRLKKPTITYKKALAGYLIDIRSKVDAYLEKAQSNSLSENEFNSAIEFANSIGIELNTNSQDNLFQSLNKPIRVCGMVKNEGEPGGGPFWVQASTTGNKSLQIVEESQVDMDDDTQKDILNKSTHFNPVDLICSITDFNGKPFNLFDFRDDETGFISYKSIEGTEIKAQELPGLWNGAMAKWITLFVEVPLITFNPVKTLKDLLREPHQKA